MDLSVVMALRKAVLVVKLIHIYKRGRRFATNQKAPHMYVNYVVFRKQPLEFQ